MRKIVALMVMMWAISLTVRAVDIVIDIDDPAKVEVTYLSYADAEDYIGTPVAVGLQPGINNVDIPQAYTTISITATQGNLLTSVRWKGYDEPLRNADTAASVYLYGNSDTGQILAISTAKEEDIRTAHVAVTADVPTDVSFMFAGTYRSVSLAEGENDIAFDPNSEATVRLHHASAGQVLYRVLHNESEMEAGGSLGYEFSISDGDRIDITAAFPEEQYLLRINIPAELQQAVTSMKINGKTKQLNAVFDSGISVQAGAKVEISIDNENYRINKVEMNGTEAAVHYYLSFVMTEAMNIDIDASLFSMLKIKLDVTNPSHLHVYHGPYLAGGANAEYNLSAGINEVEVSERYGYVTVMLVEGNYFTDFRCGNVHYSGKSDYGYGIRVENLTDGDVVTLHTAQIVRDKHFVFYVDNKEACNYQFFCERFDYSEATIATGYNIVDFYDGDNPFEIGWAGENIAFYLYRNGTLLSPTYENTSYATLNVAEGDVIKAFTTAAPACFTATFNVEDGNPSDLRVKKDLYTAVQQWQEGISDFQGTLINIKGATGVLVDGEAIAPETDGSFSFTLEADCAVTITGTDGIEPVDPDSASSGNVYNAQGVLLMERATPDQLNSLPHGFYIIGSRKVLR